MPLAISWYSPWWKWRPVTTNQIITIDSMMTDWIYSKTNIFWHLLTHCLKETTTKLFTNDTHGSLWWPSPPVPCRSQHTARARHHQWRRQCQPCGAGPSSTSKMCDPNGTKKNKTSHESLHGQCMWTIPYFGIQSCAKQALSCFSACLLFSHVAVVIKHTMSKTDHVVSHVLGRRIFCLTKIKAYAYDVGKTIIDSWYKPFLNGWCMALLYPPYLGAAIHWIIQASAVATLAWVRMRQCRQPAAMCRTCVDPGQIQGFDQSPHADHTCSHHALKADSTLSTFQPVPQVSTARALSCLTSEVKRDPVHSGGYGCIFFVYQQIKKSKYMYI